jgi:hypothetical protein
VRGELIPWTALKKRGQTLKTKNRKRETNLKEKEKKKKNSE